MIYGTFTYGQSAYGQAIENRIKISITSSVSITSSLTATAADLQVKREAIKGKYPKI